MARSLRPSAARGLPLVAAGLCVAAWLPFLHRPLSSDEAGFLLLGQQWTHGTSLYGDYWVDRPPLLVGLFSVVVHLAPIGESAAGPTDAGVKLLGALASGVAVLLAAWLAGLVATDGSRRRTAVTVLAAALLCSPLLGMPETDGEILAVPFVLLGLVLLVRSLLRSGGVPSVLLAAGAGMAGMAAALVKQNAVDVMVFAVVAFVSARGRVDGLRPRLLAFGAGAAAMLVVTVAAATARGTPPIGLWNAVVVFRLHASSVIASSATSSTPERMSHLGLAFLASGAAVVLLVASASVARAGRRSVLGPPVLAVVGWELCAVLLGGSYWLHYLTGLVPGLVLLVGLARPERYRRALAACLAYVVAASVVGWVFLLATPAGTGTESARVESYLRAHAHPGDGVVVAFGRPDIVAGSGLSSPYPELWSLPVRVRDHRLRGLRRVMAGHEAPRWMVVAGHSLVSWGLDAQRAQHYLERHYVEQVTYGDWHVWRRDGRPPA